MLVRKKIKFFSLLCHIQYDSLCKCYKFFFKQRHKYSVWVTKTSMIYKGIGIHSIQPQWSQFKKNTVVKPLSPNINQSPNNTRMLPVILCEIPFESPVATSRQILICQLNALMRTTTLSHPLHLCQHICLVFLNKICPCLFVLREKDKFHRNQNVICGHIEFVLGLYQICIGFVSNLY